jgi:hypothetical protein
MQLKQSTTSKWRSCRSAMMTKRWATETRHPRGSREANEHLSNITSKSCQCPLAIHSDQSYFRAIRNIPAVLGQVFDHLAFTTGWRFSVLMGGPHPQFPLADIQVTSFHRGTSLLLGNSFGSAFPDFDGEILRPYGEFVRATYGKIDIFSEMSVYLCLCCRTRGG